MNRARFLLILAAMCWACGANGQFSAPPAGDPSNCYCPDAEIALYSRPPMPIAVCRGDEIEVCASVSQKSGSCENVPFVYTTNDIQYHWEVLNMKAEPQSGKTQCARFKPLSSGKGSIVFNVTASRKDPMVCFESLSSSIVFNVYINDLDIDSDNNNGFNPPDQSSHEDAIEELVGRPGKILVVNDSDADLDGIPNFADGFALFAPEGRIAGGPFVPISVSLSPLADSKAGEVKFIYSSAPPDQSTRTGDGSRGNPHFYDPGSPGLLRLWNINGTARRRSADLSAGGNFIESGKGYPLALFGSNYWFFAYVEAVRSCAQPGDASISIMLDPDGASGPLPWVCGDTVRATTMRAQIGIDWNRDRILSFDGRDVTSPQRYYRFWLNNDRDTGDDHEAEDLNPSAGPTDGQDEIITCMRDLEDLSPLGIRFEGPQSILEMVGSGVIQVGLHSRPLSGAPQNRLFRASEQSGRFTYLDQESAAREQAKNPKFNQSMGSPPGYGTFLLSTTGTNLLGEVPVSGGNFCALYEGRTAGRVRYALTLSMTNNDMGAASFAYLETQDIRKMYEHWTVGDNTTNDVDRIPAAASEINGFRYSAASPVTTDYILFVHGWRMQPWERRHFAETAYKRLFWAGYDGKFGLFSWPTDYADNLIIDPQNYDRSEFRAWRSAPALRDLVVNLNNASPGSVRILAHSMGNVVASEALRLEAESDSPDIIVRAYAASQAASVAHAYDGTVNPVEWDLTTDTPEVYANYPPTGRPYFARIASAAGDIINLYNEEDHALGWWMYNQDVKPDFRYDYEFVGLDMSRRQWTHKPAGGELRVLDFPANTHEIYALVAEARSRALGAEGKTQGAIFRQLNLKNSFGFGSERYEHSAQFNSIYLHRYSYWSEIMNRLYIKGLK